MVEYGLLLALIAVIAIVAVQALGDSVSPKFSHVNEQPHHQLTSSRSHATRGRR